MSDVLHCNKTLGWDNLEKSPRNPFDVELGEYFGKILADHTPEDLGCEYDIIKTYPDGMILTYSFGCTEENEILLTSITCDRKEK